MYRINFFRMSTSLELRKHLVEALLIPLVDYCSLIIYDRSDELDLKIQRIINSGIRYLYGLKRNEYFTPYRYSLGWLTTVSRRRYFIATILFKMFRSYRTEYLVERYIANTSDRPVRDHYLLTLCIPSFRKEFLERSFYVNGSYL